MPKGPSPNPADKRLAMHVEPHPLDYAEFEGVIPKGEYGAGPAIVWDKGTWVPVEDVAAGFAKGKLLFELWGYKVKGLWTLVHAPKAGANHWLLIKEKDEHVDRGGTAVYPDDSIYSGLDVDDLPRAAEIQAEMEECARAAGARRWGIAPDQPQRERPHPNLPRSRARDPRSAVRGPRARRRGGRPRRAWPSLLRPPAAAGPLAKRARHRARRCRAWAPCASPTTSPSRARRS